MPASLAQPFGKNEAVEAQRLHEGAVGKEQFREGIHGRHAQEDLGYIRQKEIGQRQHHPPVVEDIERLKNIYEPDILHKDENRVERARGGQGADCIHFVTRRSSLRAIWRRIERTQARRSLTAGLPPVE